jgi:hypothetical protein
MTGLLVCLPTAALLVSAVLALLVDKLRQAADRRFPHRGTTQAEMGRPLAGRRNQEGMCDDTPLSSVPAGRLQIVVRALPFPAPQECQYPALAWSHGSR